VAVDCLAISYRLARNPLPVERLLFNAAAPPLAMWIAAHLFFLAAGSSPSSPERGSLDRVAPALLLAAGAYFLLNTFAVAIAIALHERTGVMRIWKAHFQELWLSFLGGAVAAGIVVYALQDGKYGAAVLGLPLLLAIVLHFAYRNVTGRAEDQFQHLAELNRLHLSTIESLAHAIDAKDAVTHSHIRRVQTVALLLARRIGLTDESQLKALEAAALLHDIGKLAVPEHILNKPGRLTPAEFERMKTHAAVGAEILAEVDFPYPVVPIVRHHHENWDGSGYPDGLSGENIPIGARILSVIDCFDALTSDRPYRGALTPRAAFDIIRERRGRMYDPALVDAFEEIYTTLETEGQAEPRRPQPRPAPSGPSTAELPASSITTVAAAFELGLNLAAARDTDVAALVWRYLSRLPRVRSMVVYRLDGTREKLMATCAAGPDREVLRKVEIPLGERLSGWVAATGQSMVNADARLDLTDLAPHLRSALAVPLRTGEIVGVVAVYSDEADAFDDMLLHLVQAAAPALATADFQQASLERGPVEPTGAHPRGGRECASPVSRNRRSAPNLGS
jgi:putative nucleotidyltransferase with HDIG domain